MNRNKKIICTALFIFSILAKISATGAGVQAGANPGLFMNESSVKLEKITGTLTGTLKFSRIPMVVGFGFEAGKAFSEVSYGFSGFADYHAVDVQIINTWNFYSGFGAAGSLLTSDFKDWNVAAGARFFAGMNWLFWDNYLEFYIQQNVVPSYTRSLTVADSKGAFMLALPFESGIRLHF